MAALLAPILLIGGLALAGGGFDVSTRHIAGLIVWLLVVALLVLGAGSGARLARPLYVAAGLIVGLALLSALSSLWSGSMERSVIEADRVLVYLGFFLATFLIVQTDERRQRFAEGLTIALTLVAFLGLGSRLLPHVLNVNESLGAGPRLIYPLGYWNADGAVCGIAVAMLLWTSREAAFSALRWLSVAAIPAVLLTLYFTYSRGGLLALAIACGCLIALSRDRLWLLATLAIGAIGALPATLAVQSRDAISENLTASQAAIDQGVTVLFFLLGGIAVSLVLFALLRRAEGRGGRRTGRAVELSRHPTLLKGVALSLAVIGIGLAIAVGGRAWSQFSSSDVQLHGNPASRFSNFSGAGRSDFWSAAIDGFEEEPIIGTGAGTYEFSWNLHRSSQQSVRDAHSLYLQSFSELGLVGGLLVLALVGFLLWTGIQAWRAAPSGRRDLYAVLLGAMLAFAVGAAIDWFWEIPAVGAIFFLAAGVLTAARCAQIVAARREADSPAERHAFGLAVGGLAIAWISALALIGPLLVDHELKASQSSAANGDLNGAISHANTARSVEPWAASPYVQLGLIAEQQHEFAVANERLSQAIEREEDNWQLYYLRSRVEHEAGEPAAAIADFLHAHRLNPREACLREGKGWVCE